MKISKSQKGDFVSISAKATADEVNRAFDRAYIAFANDVGLKPDPGKSIKDAALEQMGLKDLDSVVKDNVADALIPLAIDKSALIPMVPPKAQTKSTPRRDQEFSFEFDLVEKPTYELKSYDPVSIKLPRFKFDESAIDRQLVDMASSYTVYKASPDADQDKTVEKGDAVLLSLVAKDGDEELKNLSTSGRTYIVGEGYMPEGFDENIIGMKAGETKTFSFDAPTFDDEFNQKMSTLDAEVKIIEFQSEAKPEVDDEWVKANLPMYSGVDELREDMRKSMEQAAKDEYEAMSRVAVAQEVAKRFDGKIADEAYVSMRDQMMASIKAQVAQSGRTWDQFIEENGGEQQFTMLLMLQVRENLQEGYALDAVFDHEKLSLDDEDIARACKTVAPNADAKEVRAYFEENGGLFSLLESARRLKANEWLLDRAKIEYEGAPREEGE